MTKFICINCNYRFDADRQPITCHYCGKAKVIKEPDAEELLNEA